MEGFEVVTIVGRKVKAKMDDNLVRSEVNESVSK